MPCWRRRPCSRLPAWAALGYLVMMLMMMMLLLCPHRAQAHVDNCNWKGSGLTDTLIAPGTASIVQLSLHCAQGSLEWLYPSGALRVLLHAPAAMARGGRLVVCLKPLPGSHGANVYVERPGELQLAVDEASGGSGRVHCVPAGHGERDDGGAATALFIQAVPQTDISRKVTALRYELRPEGAQVVVPGRDAGDPDDACRPCSDAEMLMAACVSDFVAKGEITSVSHDKGEGQSIVRVSIAKVFQQKEKIFQQQRTAGDGARTLEEQQRTLGDEPRMLGEVRTPLWCGVKHGEGTFLFTGGLHFGQAWLGCAPWYEGFRRAYEQARSTGDNPCELQLD
ncbi:meteorin-like protein [Petromyzon marinus]|uniref:Meteorin-like protein n=1 Tax=Petromyzon marinus TaxID=7757 RepID=S4RMP8_PETMA